jgi:hypothetical protein
MLVPEKSRDTYQKIAPAVLRPSTLLMLSVRNRVLGALLVPPSPHPSEWALHLCQAPTYPAIQLNKPESDDMRWTIASYDFVAML